MSLRVLREKEWRLPMAMGLVLGGLVTAGFLPASRAIFHALPWTPAGPELARVLEMACFPLLAFVFAVTIPWRKPQHRKNLSELAQTLLVPFLISVVFGLFVPGTADRPTLMWYLLFIPFGEELLFRGWLYGFIDWLWPEKMMTATNPFPVAVWATAAAFSAWHLQNLAVSPTGLVLFQVGYTFFTGMWLGYLRWRTGGVLLPIAAHASLNLGASF